MRVGDVLPEDSSIRGPMGETGAGGGVWFSGTTEKIRCFPSGIHWRPVSTEENLGWTNVGVSESILAQYSAVPLSVKTVNAKSWLLCDHFTSPIFG